MSAKMSTYKVGSARAMGRQRLREPVRASSVPRRSLKRTRGESGGMTENVANDPTGAESVFAVSTVSVGSGRKSTRLPWRRDGRKGDLLKRSHGSPLLAGKELWVKVLATMAVLGSTLSVRGVRLSVKLGSFVEDAIRSLTSGKGGK